MSYYEVMLRSLELAETMLTGIEHIRIKFAEGRFEEVLLLLQDITQAMMSILNASQRVEEDLLVNSTDRLERLQRGLSNLVSAYEYKDWDQALKALENEVVPGFIAWKEELERCYRPAVVS